MLRWDSATEKEWSQRGIRGADQG